MNTVFQRYPQLLYLILQQQLIMNILNMWKTKNLPNTGEAVVVCAREAGADALIDNEKLQHSTALKGEKAEISCLV